MAKNIIFYFSGTGNSLKVSKDFAESLGDCECVSMAKLHTLSGGYERIGFVYPIYFCGLPGVVKRFIENLDISENKDTYFFATCTAGRTPGGFREISKNLAKKGGKLRYAKFIACYSNYVCMYPMRSDAKEKAEAQAKATKQAALDIQTKSESEIPKDSILSFANGWLIKNAATKDRFYSVSDACDGCGICSKVCPVDNIKMENKPIFLHHCEQCVACIQWCPKQAINYKNKTQNRGRYHHPDITVADMIIE